MKKTFITFLLIIVSFISGFFLNNIRQKNIPELNKISVPSVLKQRPLDKYTIDNLSSTQIQPGAFEPSTKLAETDKYVSYNFNFRFKPDRDKTKSISGQINIPSGKEAKNFPIIVMLRGYVDQKIYKTGDGTRNAAKYFAENGFITIAPDFLGYANSDEEAGNIFESRFQTYTTTLALLKSLNTDLTLRWDKKNIFLWGHSNGGQIVLTILEISGVSYPSILWAPISKPFPYSILYYTDESEDHGKLIRNELSKFEELYDVELYSQTNYLDRINAPLQIHQGSADIEVPISWTNELVDTLKKDGKSVNYFTYSETDHNLRPSWDTVVARDLEFFNKNLK